MTSKHIIAEIKNLLKNYAQHGLVDELTLKNLIKRNIKKFGGNIMNEYQTVLIVEKGKAKLPDNFWALKAAVKCEQEGYVEEKSHKHIQRRISYLEWTDIKDYYNYLDGRPCLEDDDSRYITETLYFETPEKAYKFYYKQPQLLNLVSHKYTVRCDADCPNLVCDSPYDISIDENHNYLTTNFNEGFVWLWYKGLPCDEKGQLHINTSRDALADYLIYSGVVRTMENIWLAEDDPNIFNKLQYFKSLENEYYYEAKSESVNKGMQGWSTKLINNNRRNTNKYENFYRSLTPGRYNSPYGSRTSNPNIPY